MSYVLASMSRLFQLAKKYAKIQATKDAEIQVTKKAEIVSMGNLCK